MAFQHNPTIMALLKQCAQSAPLSQRAPGENFILDENSAPARETEYLGKMLEAAGGDPISYGSWARAHKSHGYELVAAKAHGASSVRFTNRNAYNLALSRELESNTVVVRLESLDGLFGIHSGNYDSLKDLYSDLSQWIAKHKSGSAKAQDYPQLADWLDAINGKRDQRPSWVTTYAAVSSILKKKKGWAKRLRDALGLAHLSANGSEPHRVVLLQYALTRVSEAHRTAPGWAALPTVFDDVGASGINTVFFPVARAVAKDKMGSSVDLDPTENLIVPEFLHARIDYRLEDFKRVSELSDVVLESALEAARVRHLSANRVGYQFSTDLP